MSTEAVSVNREMIAPIRATLQYATDGELPAPAHGQLQEFHWNRPVASWTELFTAAAEHYGVAGFVVRKSVRQVMETASPQSPWVTYIGDDPDIRGWIVLREKWGGKVKLAICGDKVRIITVTTERFMQALGAASQDQLLDWTGVDSRHSHTDDDEQPPTTGHGGNGSGGRSHTAHGSHGSARPTDQIRALFHEERSTLWVIIIYSVAIGLLSLVVPVAVQALVNTVAFGTVLQPLVVLTAIVLVVLAFAGVLTAMRTYMVEIMQRRLFARISAQIMHKLLHVRKDAFDSMHGPELVNRFFDIITVQKAAAFLLIDGMAIITSTIIGLVLLGFYHPLLLVFDLILLALIFFVLWPLGIGAIHTAVDESFAKYSVAAWLEELARNTVTFKSGSGVQYAFSRTDELVTTWSVRRRAHFRVLFRQVIGTVFIQALASAALLGFGGWLVIERQLTLGQLVAAELIVTLVVTSFAKFGKQLETFYDLTAASNKVGHLLDLPVEESGTEPAPDPGRPAAVTLHKVTYGYASKKTVLDGINLDVSPGQRVGIVGLGSSGKSTMVDMLYGLRRPTQGFLALDGMDYRQLSLRDLRTQVSLVREVEIFEGSIADNVRLGNPDVSLQEIRRVLRQVGIFEAVNALPNGIDTELLTGGRPLSPRQAVALMVARAIVSQPRLLIVDEDFVALDDIDCEADLVNVLCDREQPWTLILIAHASSLRLIANRCDTLYFMEKGTLRPVIEEDFQYSV